MRFDWKKSQACVSVESKRLKISWSHLFFCLYINTATLLFLGGGIFIFTHGEAKISPNRSRIATPDPPDEIEIFIKMKIFLSFRLPGCYLTMRLGLNGLESGGRCETPPPPQMLQHIARRPSNFRLGDLSWVLSKAQRFLIFILIDNCFR